MFFQNANQSKIGILGGTFNPIHNGHIAIAEAARKELELDQVLVMPSGQPPHKRGLQIASAQDRSNMVQLAIADWKGLTFSDYEIRREGYSYSANTLEDFSARYGVVYFIIGADSLFQIRNWYHPEKVMEYAVLAVAGRDAKSREELESQASQLRKRYGARIVFLNCPDTPVSSSIIRKLCAEGKAIDGLVPPKVRDYIMDKGLYQDGWE